MNKEELDILNDVLYSESSWYVYDYQGFDYETIFPIIEKLIKINKKQKEVLDKIKEWILYQQQSNENLEPYISTDKLDDILELLEEIE